MTTSVVVVGSDITFTGEGDLTSAVVGNTLSGLSNMRVVIAGYTSIGTSAFSWKGQIASIVIGSSIQQIGDTAFESVCKQLDFSTSVSARLVVTWTTGMAFEELVVQRVVNLSLERRLSKLSGLLFSSVRLTLLPL